MLSRSRAPSFARTVRAFTLIELLVVIGIVAALSVVVILVLNPAEILRQSRDSNRLADMSSLNTALGLYVAQGGASFGSSNVVYVSIPDTVATSSVGDQCQGLGLISLPLGWNYHCAPTSTYRNINGTGWVPVNFTTLSGGAPLSHLPIDPSQSSSSRYYYSYATNGSQFEATAIMESQAYKLGGSKDVISADGGSFASVYEKGTKLGLEPLDYGDSSLIGYWPFEEGTNTIAYDYSGTNATGSWSGTATGTFGYYSAGKVGSYAGTFDGVSTYVANAANNAVFNLSNGVTMLAWVKMTAGGVDQKIISKRPSYVLTVYNTNVPETEIFIASTSYDTRSVGGGTTLVVGRWYQIAGTYDGATLKTYVNGALDRQTGVSGNMDSVANALDIGKTADGVANYFNGFIDNARVYNRALSAAEIAAIYNAGR
jgi:prepilin-type N-terminal cleavage/methylation domain-containing protein